MQVKVLKRPTVHVLTDGERTLTLGYVVDLPPRNGTDGVRAALAVVQQLKVSVSIIRLRDRVVISILQNNSWIDPGTRMVSIEFVTYCPSLNHFGYVTMVLGTSAGV